MAAEERDPLAIQFTIKHDGQITDRYQVEFPQYVDPIASGLPGLKPPPEYVAISAGGRREVLRRTKEQRGQRTTLNVSRESTLPDGAKVTGLKAATKPQYTWFLIRSQPHRLILFAGLAITLLALLATTVLDALVDVGVVSEASPAALVGHIAADFLTWIGALIAFVGIFYEG